MLVPGYVLKTHYSREDHRKGGVAIYVKKNFEHIADTVEITQYSQEFVCELALLKLRISRNKSMYIMGTYRSPDRNLDEALDIISSVLNDKELDKTPLIIMGDINVDRLKLDRKTAKVEEMLAHHNIKRIALPPTRITPDTISSIDWICTNENIENLTTEVIHAGLSDHTAQTCEVYIQNKVQKPGEMRRHFNARNLLNLKTELQQESWEGVTQAATTELAYNNFLNTLKLVLDTTCPHKKTRQNKKHKPKHFADQESHRLKEAYTQSLANYHLTGSIPDKVKTAELKKTYDLRLKTLRKEASIQHINTADNKSKATWEVINNAWIRKNIKQNEMKLNINGVLTDNPQEVAEQLNKFFVSIAQQTLSTNPVRKQTQIQNQPSMNKLPHLSYTNKNEVTKTINALKTKNSAGTDEISSKVLKYCCEELTKPLTEIINKSFRDGEFPSKMKISKVYPKLKNGCTTLASNYRPISLISTFSKVCEKIALQRLLSHCTKYSLLTNAQHGFTKGKSTTTAMIQLIEQITDNLEKGSLTTALFLDYSKAFDCLGHDLVITKLESLGITGTAIKWFKSYLEGRSQLVELHTSENGITKTATSRPLPVNRGVPQGSVLGPALFILFTNDLPGYLDNLSSIVMYADDTTLLLSEGTADDLAVTSYIALNTAYQYCHENDLVVNPSKTNQVAFGRRAGEVHHIPNVELSHQAKLLGIIVDGGLTWTPHIDSLCQKLNSSLYAIKRIKAISDTKTALTAYHALFESHMRYGLTVWGGTSSGNLNRVLVLQKKAVRYIAGLKHRESCKNSFKLLKIPTVIAVYILDTIMYVEGKDMLRGNHIHQHNTRNATSFILPIHHLSKFEKKPTYMGRKLYNNLPAELRVKTGKELKKALSDWLIRRPLYTIEEFFQAGTST